MGNGLVLDVRAQPLGEDQGLLEVGPRKQYAELLTADPPEEVILAKSLGRGLREILEYLLKRDSNSYSRLRLVWRGFRAAVFLSRGNSICLCVVTLSASQASWTTIEGSRFVARLPCTGGWADPR